MSERAAQLGNDTDRLTIEALLSDARSDLQRVTGAQLNEIRQDGGHVTDFRNDHTRLPEGHIPGSVVIDRLVLEWRLDPTSGAVMDDAPASTT